MPKFAPDTIKELEKSDLIQFSRALLDSVVESTDMLTIQEMTPKKLQEAKIVLGFLNAARNAMDTKIKMFKLTGLDKKINAVAKHNGKK